MLSTHPPAPASQRIIVFGSYAPSLINFRGRLIATLKARGHEVFALAPDMSEEISAQLRALGAEPIEVQLRRGSLDPRIAWRSARDLRRVFEAVRPDTVIAYTISPILLAASAARAVGARFMPLVTGLGIAFLEGRRPKQVLVRLAATIMYRRAFNKASMAFFQNESDRSDFLRSHVLPRRLPTAILAGSGVDLQKHEPQPVPDGVVFLMMARFLRYKGVLTYGAAVARLKREHPHVRFLLAGWIDRSPDAISQEELDEIVAGGVECLGKLDDVRPALAQCTVYVHPSKSEGISRSILEAMAAGRAILTTDAPGCRETVDEGVNGLLVPPADVDALEQAMRRFIADPALAARMGERSRRIAEEIYDVDKVNAAMIAHAGL